MRAVLLTSFFCASAITGCSLFGEVRSTTQPMNAATVTVKHNYKLPKKSPLNRFKDPQLHQLIAVALADAPDMHSAKARVVRAQQVAKGAYSALWPVVDFSGYYQKQQFPAIGLVPPPFNGLSFSIADLALNFNYQIDFWGKNRETLASRLNETFAAQMDLAETQLVLSAAVATAYFELQGNLIQYKLAKENVGLQKELSDIVFDRAKRGIESDIPVQTALANTQAAILSVEDFKRAEMQSRHQLAVLLGKNPLTTKIETGAFIYHKKQLLLPKEVSVNILAQRPDIAAARALAEAAAHQVKVAKANFLPNFNLIGLLSLQTIVLSELFDLKNQSNFITTAVDLPIFDAGSRRANLGVKYAEYELAVNQYNQTILTALRQVADQLSALKTLSKQVLAQRKALNTTEANYKLFRSRYNQGIIDYVQLVEIKQLLLQQKAMLFNIQARQKQAYVGLLAALGDGVFL